MLKKPEPFEHGNITLWDNEYIGNNVLKKHLEFNVDSGSRKIDTIAQTSQWIKKMFTSCRNILDIGCGPGLYSRFLSELGFFYTGIDISPFQINYAVKHSAYDSKTHFYQSDFRIWESNEYYDIVLMLYGIYSFYPRKDRMDLLNRLRTRLNNNGSVLIEVFTPNHYLGRSESRDWTFFEKDGFWDAKPYLELNAFYRYDEINLILIQSAVINDSIRIWNSWIQTFLPKTIIEELQYCGFNNFRLYGSCTGDRYTDDSEVLFLCASVN